MATADKVLGVLELFSSDNWRWTVEEAAEALELPTSTTYRYFRSLAKAELISPQASGAYVLGPAVCKLDRAMRLYDPFINAARDEMRHLASAHGDTIILLARLYRNSVMCVHREGGGLVASGYERGRPMPLELGAASKVILANLSSRQLHGLSGPGGEALDLSYLRPELRAIKANGYAVTFGEIDPTKMGVSVPVFRGKQMLEGSLSFVVDTSRKDEQEALVQALIRSRKAIEANLLIAEFRSSAGEEPAA